MPQDKQANLLARGMMLDAFNARAQAKKHYLDSLVSQALENIHPEPMHIQAPAMIHADDPDLQPRARIIADPEELDEEDPVLADIEGLPRQKQQPLEPPDMYSPLTSKLGVAGGSHVPTDVASPPLSTVVNKTNANRRTSNPVTGRYSGSTIIGQPTLGQQVPPKQKLARAGLNTAMLYSSGALDHPEIKPVRKTRSVRKPFEPKPSLYIPDDTSIASIVAADEEKRQSKKKADFASMGDPTNLGTAQGVLDEEDTLEENTGLEDSEDQIPQQMTPPQSREMSPIQTPSISMPKLSAYREKTAVLGWLRGLLGGAAKAAPKVVNPMVRSTTEAAPGFMRRASPYVVPTAMIGTMGLAAAPQFMPDANARAIQQSSLIAAKMQELRQKNETAAFAPPPEQHPKFQQIQQHLIDTQKMTPEAAAEAAQRTVHGLVTGESEGSPYANLLGDDSKLTPENINKYYGHIQSNPQYQKNFDFWKSLQQPQAQPQMDAQAPASPPSVAPQAGLVGGGAPKQPAAALPSEPEIPQTDTPTTSSPSLWDRMSNNGVLNNSLALGGAGLGAYGLASALDPGTDAQGKKKSRLPGLLAGGLGAGIGAYGLSGGDMGSLFKPDFWKTSAICAALEKKANPTALFPGVSQAKPNAAMTMAPKPIAPAPPAPGPQPPQQQPQAQQPVQPPKPDAQAATTSGQQIPQQQQAAGPFGGALASVNSFVSGFGQPNSEQVMRAARDPDVRQLMVNQARGEMANFKPPEAGILPAASRWWDSADWGQRAATIGGLGLLGAGAYGLASNATRGRRRRDDDEEDEGGISDYIAPLLMGAGGAALGSYGLTGDMNPFSGKLLNPAQWVGQPGHTMNQPMTVDGPDGTQVPMHPELPPEAENDPALAAQHHSQAAEAMAQSVPISKVLQGASVGGVQGQQKLVQTISALSKLPPEAQVRYFARQMQQDPEGIAIVGALGGNGNEEVAAQLGQLAQGVGLPPEAMDGLVQSAGKAWQLGEQAGFEPNRISGALANPAQQRDMMLRFGTQLGGAAGLHGGGSIPGLANAAIKGSINP